MGIHFLGACVLAFVKDLNLLTPTLSGLNILIDVYENILMSLILCSMDPKVIYFYLREGTVRF